MVHRGYQHDLILTASGHPPSSASTGCSPAPATGVASLPMRPWRIARADRVGSVVAGLALPAAADLPVSEYLGRLDAKLPAAHRVRRGVLAEVGDGIACAVESRMADGASASAAARAALTELGAAEDLAASMAAEIAPWSAHRTGLLLLIGGPVVGLAWVAASPPAAGPWDRVEQALLAVPPYPVLLALAVPAALIAFAGAGLLRRRLPVLGSASVVASMWAGVACVAGDAMLLVAASSFDAPSPWLTVAVAASLLRLTAASVAVRRIARLNAVAHRATG